MKRMRQLSYIEFNVLISHPPTCLVADMITCTQSIVVTTDNLNEDKPSHVTSWSAVCV